jgi:hypothetical protein
VIPKINSLGLILRLGGFTMGDNNDDGVDFNLYDDDDSGDDFDESTYELQLFEDTTSVSNIETRLNNFRTRITRRKRHYTNQLYNQNLLIYYSRIKKERGL